MVQKTALTALLATSGCLGTVEGVFNNPHSIDDIIVNNESDTVQDVRLLVTDTDGSPVLDKSFKLSPDGEKTSNKRLTNPLKNGQSYTVVVETKSGLRGKYDWSAESENGGRVYVEIHDGRIEMIEGDA
jgi:hypothetical protein